MKESEFLDLLKMKAEEQHEVFSSGLLPGWASFLGEWFGVNPWRVILMISVVLYVGLRVVFGEGVREFVLYLFGGY